MGSLIFWQIFKLVVLKMFFFFFQMEMSWIIYLQLSHTIGFRGMLQIALFCLCYLVKLYICSYLTVNLKYIYVSYEYIYTYIIFLFSCVISVAGNLSLFSSVSVFILKMLKDCECVIWNLMLHLIMKKKYKVVDFFFFLCMFCTRAIQDC